VSCRRYPAMHSAVVKWASSLLSRRLWRPARSQGCRFHSPDLPSSMADDEDLRDFGLKMWAVTYSHPPRKPARRSPVVM
jgi:hypothetical protein